MARAFPENPQGTGWGGFWRGATYPWRGLVHLAHHRQTWLYAAAPALVYLVLLLVLGVVALLVLDDVYRWLQPDWLAHPSTHAGWLMGLWRVLLRALLAVAVFLMVAAGAILATLLVAAILAGPFNEKLSEVVELSATGRRPPEEPFSLRTLTRESARAILAALELLALCGGLYIPLLLCSLLPFVGLMGFIATFLYSCYFLALNFLDPTLDRHKLTLPDKLRWTRSILAAHMGFGTALFGLMLVPVLNLLVAPCFVAGGTLLWLDLQPREEQIPLTRRPPLPR